MTREEIANKRSFKFMIDYIENNKTDIPENLRCSVMNDEYGLTLAMYWVLIMKNNTPVPRWMQHEPYITDCHKWTIAMHWITTCHTNPPAWMWHKSYLQNDNGKTAGMLMLLYGTIDNENNDLPDWMQHDVNIYDNENYTIVDYWIIICKSKPLPTWIVEQLNKNELWKNHRGETLREIWQKFRENEQLMLTDNPLLASNEKENEEEQSLDDESKDLLNLINNN